MNHNSISTSKRIMHPNPEQSETATELSQYSPKTRVINFKHSLQINRFFQPDSTTAGADSNECKVISSIYKPVIFCLRFMGACPICIDQTDKEIVYSFKICSGVSIANAIVSCSIIFFYLYWVAGLTHLQYLVQNVEVKNIISDGVFRSPGCKSVLTSFLKRALPMQLPVNTSVNIIASLTSIPKFVQLLGKWSQFENKFQKKLNTIRSPYVDLNRTRNKLAVCYLTFAGVYCALVVFVVTKPCIPSILVCSWWVKLVGVVVVLPYTMYTFMEDFKFLFMFRTLEAGFTQVYLKIKEQNEQTYQLPGILLSDKVEKWQDLLQDLRQQTQLVSSCSSFHHVVSISTTFFSLLVGVYFSILFQFSTTAVDEEKSGIAVAAMGFCAVGFSRCLIKTNGSERVLNAEKMVVDQLSVVKTGDDIRTQIKINALVDLIGRDPAQITILNSFKLNTSFLFQIIGQIATYLIVFLQFDFLTFNNK